MNRIWVGFGLVLFAASCADDAAPSVSAAKSYTKTEAAAAGGVTADGKDICELMSWYTDGVCDDFCKSFDDQCNVSTEIACGGDISTPCAAGQFCNFGVSSECGTNNAEGVCAEKPDLCPTAYTPVCGCDGTTYSNACFAASAGISTAAEGECEVGCSETNPCENGQICKAGACVTACTTNEECGEDFCTAGICGPAVTVCNEDTACSVGDFCYLGTQDACGGANGICQTIPTVCTREVDVVCGCDNVTYINPCAAATAGRNIASLGACPRACTENADCLQNEVCENAICVPAVGACGGRIGDTCALGEFCNIPAGCGFADETGTCTVIPILCAKDLAPVCGCNGITYGNPCQAAAAGISIEYDGACMTPCTANLDCNRGEVCENMVCTPAISSCGGRTGGICSATQWCDYGGPINACGDADATGTCQPRPTICPPVLTPVCGCDGNAYNNACVANSAGVDIRNIGDCLM